ncbi:phosphoribosylformylglycinamidine synthase subunit PurQ, partial [bacterium]|nr:phosphoribosylformylglycinamidine synthase subunit PurQ [bacterium]
EAANANGSARSIAAVSNRAGNVLGLMPHPERATNELVGGADGLKIMSTALNFLNVAV